MTPDFEHDLVPYLLRRLHRTMQGMAPRIVMLDAARVARSPRTGFAVRSETLTSPSLTKTIGTSTNPASCSSRSATSE